MTLAEIFARIGESPHARLLGAEWSGFDPGTRTVTVRFQARKELCTGRGGIQGGLVGGFLDEVMGYAHICASGGQQAPLNLDLSYAMLRMIPAGATFFGKGRVVRAGSRIVFLEGELVDGEGEVYARGASTALIGPPPSGLR